MFGLELEMRATGGRNTILWPFLIDDNDMLLKKVWGKGFLIWIKKLKQYITPRKTKGNLTIITPNYLGLP